MKTCNDSDVRPRPLKDIAIRNCCFDDPLLGKALGRVQRRAESDLRVADVVMVPEARAEVGDGLRDGVLRLQELVASGVGKNFLVLRTKFLLRRTLQLRNKELYLL